MQDGDGAVITVRNRVPITASVSGPRYALSTLGITALENPRARLNRTACVGISHSLRPGREAVLMLMRVLKLM